MVSHKEKTRGASDGVGGCGAEEAPEARLEPFLSLLKNYSL